MARVEITPAAREGRIWVNACTKCGTANPTTAGHLPASCAGCGASPVPVLGADVIDDSAWAQSPDDRRRIEAAARTERAKRAELRAERIARMARAALAMRQRGPEKLNET